MKERAKRVGVILACPHGEFLAHRRWWGGTCYPNWWVDDTDDLDKPLYTFEGRHGKVWYSRQDLIDMFVRSGATE